MRVFFLVDVVCLWQDVAECSMGDMKPPSRNDEQNLVTENRREVMEFAAGWNPYEVHQHC